MVDRLKVRAEHQQRLCESVETALSLADGMMQQLTLSMVIMTIYCIQTNARSVALVSRVYRPDIFHLIAHLVLALRRSGFKASI